jgi:hypothetical protein
MATMSRRSLLGAFGLVAVAGVAGACSSSVSTSGGSTPSSTPAAGGSLVFDKTKYTEKTATITTAAGDKEVSYRLYSKIAYVAKPVDADYQSLSIAVPTRVDGTDVDATNAPILFEIPVGGYLSAKTPDDPFAEGGGPAGGMPPGGAAPSGAAPSGAAPTGGAGAGGLPTGAGSTGQNTTEALAAGWVVVSVGARGRDNQGSDGAYFGKAPAVIVDLKAAVRYLRANKGNVPGDVDKIVSDGTSAGGAVSTLLGVSGDSPLYEKYLTDLGAADASDAIFAVAAYCPITDLENADKAYEFLFGGLPANGAAVDQTVSKELADAFPAYQDALKFQGLNGGPLTGDRYRDYLLATYLQPAATTYLSGLSDADRTTYLAANPWIRWSGGTATFTFADYLTHLGSRKKTEPAFDAFDLSAGENIEFGTATTNARHFTDYSAKKAGVALDSDVPDLLRLMNPMYFIAQKNPNRAKNYFLRVGTSDTDTAPIILSNLAAGLHGLGDTVDSLMYWDKGHGANDDPEKFVAWANRLTGR